MYYECLEDFEVNSDIVNVLIIIWKAESKLGGFYMLVY